MTPDTRTRRLRELAVSFFAGHAWVKKSDVAAVLDTEGDRPAQLPCGCYIAQCPTHRRQPDPEAHALPDPPVQP
jgi:hypothetical protein